MRFLMVALQVAAYTGTAATVLAFGLAFWAAVRRAPQYRTAAVEILNFALVCGIAVVVFAVGLAALLAHDHFTGL